MLTDTWQIKPRTIAAQILETLNQNGGQVIGTSNLCALIPASERKVKHNLAALRKRGIVRSRHTHGGSGRKAIHQLRRLSTIGSHGGRSANRRNHGRSK